jgi:DNA-binding transcriptional LysR family regulator
LHFGRAAKRLNVSQPPLSQQLMKLEEELGVKLFERTKHKVVLTPAGAAFVSEAQSALALVDQATAAVTHTTEIEIEHLSIGTVTTTESGYYRLLIGIVGRFGKLFPHVRLRLRTLSVPDQIRALKEDRIQIGFVALPVDDPDIEVLPIYSEPKGIAIPVGHPLASERNISVASLADQYQIDISKAVLFRGVDTKIEARQRHGFRLKVLHEARTVYDSLVLVSAGIGVFLVPTSFAEVPTKGMVIRKVNGLPPLEGGIAYRKDNRSVEVLSFLRLLEHRPKQELADSTVVTTSRRRHENKSSK